MPNRIGQFAPSAKAVMTLAQEESRLLQHNYIGTEHLLLGLIREESGVAGKVLRARGVTLEQVRAHVAHIIGLGPTSQPGEVDLTPRAKRVIELSVDHARRLGKRDVETEHLLLGLIDEGQGVANSILEIERQDVGALRSEILGRVGCEQARLARVARHRTDTPTDSAPR